MANRMRKQLEKLHKAIYEFGEGPCDTYYCKDCDIADLCHEINGVAGEIEATLSIEVKWDD